MFFPGPLCFRAKIVQPIPFKRVGGRWCKLWSPNLDFLNVYFLIIKYLINLILLKWHPHLHPISSTLLPKSLYVPVCHGWVLPPSQVKDEPCWSFIFYSWASSNCTRSSSLFALLESGCTYRGIDRANEMKYSLDTVSSGRPLPYHTIPYNFKR